MGLNCFEGLGIYAHISSLMITWLHSPFNCESSLEDQLRHTDLCFEGLDMLVFFGTRPDGAKNAWWTHPELTLQASELYVCTDFSVNFAKSPPKILSIILHFLAPLKYIGV
jgi:hypothetical protein